MITNELLTECYQQLWENGRSTPDFCHSVVKHARPIRVFIDNDMIPTVVYKFCLDSEPHSKTHKATSGALTTLFDALTWNAVCIEPSIWDETKPAHNQDFDNVGKQRGLSRKINLRFEHPVDLEREYFATVKLVVNSEHGAVTSGRIHNDQGKTFAFGVQDMAKVQRPRSAKL